MSAFTLTVHFEVDEDTVRDEAVVFSATLMKTIYGQVGISVTSLSMSRDEP